MIGPLTTLTKITNAKLNEVDLNFFDLNGRLNSMTLPIADEENVLKRRF